MTATAVGAVLRRRAMGGAGWVLVAVLVGLLANLGIGFVAARLLSPAQVGTFFLATAVVAVAAIPGRLGMDRAIVRMVGERRGDADGGASVAARVSLGLAAAGSLVVGAFVAWPALPLLADHGFEDDLLASIAVAVGVWTFGESLRLVVAEGHKGFFQLRQAALVSTGTRNAAALAGLGCLAFASTGDGLTWAAWASAIASVVVLGAAVLLLQPALRPGRSEATEEPRVADDHPAGRPADRPGLRREALAIGLPVTVVGVAALALAQGDVLVVGTAASADEIARYGAAVRVALFVGVPLVLVNQLLPVLVVRFNAAGARGSLEALLRTSATITTVVLLPVLLLVIVAGAAVMGLLFGPFYEEAGGILAILAVGQVLNVATGSGGVVLMMTGQQRMAMVITVAVGVVTIVGELLVVGPLGLGAVAVVSAAGIAAHGLLSALWSRRTVGIWPVCTVAPGVVRAGVRSLAQI